MAASSRSLVERPFGLWVDHLMKVVLKTWIRIRKDENQLTSSQQLLTHNHAHAQSPGGWKPVIASGREECEGNCFAKGEEAMNVQTSEQTVEARDQIEKDDGIYPTVR
jgi:hypothetical protein